MTNLTIESRALNHYRRFKKHHADCILFFLLEDFYECFFEDARTVAQALGMPLVGRSDGIDMVRVARPAGDACFRRLILAKHRVGVCEPTQVSSRPPRRTKTK